MSLAEAAKRLIRFPLAWAFCLGFALPALPDVKTYLLCATLLFLVLCIRMMGRAD